MAIIKIPAWLLAGSEGEEAQGSTNSPVEPQVSGSETDFSDFEGGGEKESRLMARVRQCSLQAINAVIDVSWRLGVGDLEGYEDKNAR